jgi:hypothetical protein
MLEIRGNVSLFKLQNKEEQSGVKRKQARGLAIGLNPDAFSSNFSINEISHRDAARAEC